jgi:hypothetical protein
MQVRKAHGTQLKEVVETRDWLIGRLIQVNGKPLTPRQERKEEKRVAAGSIAPVQVVVAGSRMAKAFLSQLVCLNTHPSLASRVCGGWPSVLPVIVGKPVPILYVQMDWRADGEERNRGTQRQGPTGRL